MNHQVISAIPYYTGIPKDVCINVFHFDWTGAGTPDSTAFGLLRDQVAAFYETAFVTAGPCAMASYAQPTQHWIKVYNLEDPAPRVPKYTATDPLSVKGDTVSQLPPEVAVCVSARGTYISGIPQARQRGRTYIGCLGSGCLDAAGTSSFPTVSTAFRTALKTAATNMVNAAATTQWRWNILSNAEGLAFPVTAGWIDNAADNQRRRGQAASARTLWP